MNSSDSMFTATDCKVFGEAVTRRRQVIGSVMNARRHQRSLPLISGRAKNAGKEQARYRKFRIGRKYPASALKKKTRALLPLSFPDGRMKNGAEKK